MITIDPPSSPSTDASPPLSKSGLSRFLNSARTLAGLEGDVDVLLTTDAELKRLNRQFRGKNKATDVLSFPVPPEIAAVHAGDLAISLDTAARQARYFGHSLRDEVRILLVHGVLHLAGFDHETEPDPSRGEMAQRESEMRKALGLPAGLIDRASRPRKVQAKRAGGRV